MFFLRAEGRGQRGGEGEGVGREEQVMDLCSRGTQAGEEVGGGAQEARSGTLSQRGEQVSSQLEWLRWLW